MFNFGATKALRAERDSLRRQLHKMLDDYAYLQGKWNQLVKRINKLGGESFLSRGEALQQQRQFSDEDLRRLLQLCHPDKHNGSSLSVEMTAKLNKARS